MIYRYVSAVLAVFLLQVHVSGHAQTYPNRAVKIIVPLAAGGGTDVVARMIGEKLSEKLGQSVIIENKPGAQGMIGVDAAAKSPADGYTIVFGSSTTMAAISSLYAKLPFDPIKDFTPVAKALDNAYNVLLVPTSLNVNNLDELIALSKKNPGQLNYGAGTASSKICIEMLKVMSGANLTLVPYKTSTQALNDLMGSQVQMVCEPTGSGMNAVKSGKVKAIAVTAPKSIEEAPGVPPASATPGLSGYEHSSWLAFFAPAGTPKDQVNRLSKDIIAVLSEPDMVARIKKTGFDVVTSGPEALGTIQKNAVEKYAKVVKDAGIKPEAN